MNQNQVFSPSGISTRGQDLDEGGNDGLDQQNNNDQQNHLLRPLTTNSQFNSNQSLIESFNDIPMLPITNNNSIASSTSFLSIFANGSQLTSFSLHQKFSKLIKLERKKLIKQNELIKEIQNWCNILTNDDCKTLLYNYIKILELEIETNDQLIKRREFINQQLLDVHKREKRTNELKLKRNKILVKLRENENKVGDSPITTLTKENLEELECSVDIVEDQFIRSINNGLKNSLLEYLIIYQNQIIKFKDTCKKFLDNYYINTNPTTASGNTNCNSSSSNINLQRLIIQNKLNSGLISREISSSANTNQPKYIALSPNQIGKYLDNRFIDIDQDPSSKLPQDHQKNQNHRINQPTIISLTDAEISKLKKLQNINGQQSSHYNVQPGNPPPTASTNKDLTKSNNKSQDSDNDTATYIINHYSTPGGLGIRPPTSTNHEWT